VEEKYSDMGKMIHNKIKAYEEAILEVLEAEKIIRTDSDVEDIVLSDKDKRYYQLIRMGWETPSLFLHKIIFHFHIAADGKIWLLENNTDIPITEELLKKGIPQTDIVLGFHPTQYRPYTGYAVA